MQATSLASLPVCALYFDSQSTCILAAKLQKTHKQGCQACSLPGLAASNMGYKLHDGISGDEDGGEARGTNQLHIDLNSDIEALPS